VLGELGKFCLTDDPRPLVVYATDRFLPARGGVQTYIQQLIDCMADKYRFVVLTAIRNEESLDEALLQPEPSMVERWGSWTLDAVVVSLRLGPAAAEAYRSQRADEDTANAADPSSYHINRWHTMELLAGLLSDEIGPMFPPNVIVHAMGPWEMSLVAERIFPAARRVVTPFVHPGHWGEDEASVRWLRTADAIVALTAQDREVCQSLGLPPERTFLVPVPYVRRGMDEGDASHRNLVVYVGVNRPYKGIDIFVAAADQLAKKWSGFEFIVLTSSSQSGPLAASRTSSMGARLVASPSDVERDHILRRSACVCLPSASEISPYAILEGWDHGAPAVVTDNEHFRSFVAGGGLFVSRDPASLAAAVTRILEGSVDSQDLVEIGRDRLDLLHEPKAVAELLKEVYQGAYP